MSKQETRMSRRSQREPWWNLKRRRWFYGSLVAAGGVALTYGLLTAEQLAAWLMLGAALLGVAGMALTHPTPDE